MANEQEALNIALSKSECLVSKTYLGYDKITNVCTGKTFDVSWGLGDWSALVAITILSIFVLILFIAIARMLLDDC